MQDITTPDVLIIGCGPTGMAAALELAKDKELNILIVDRDDDAGGLPRFCDHPGFGWEYSYRLHTGPAFVRFMLNKIQQHPNITLLIKSTVTNIQPGPTVSLVSAEHGCIEASPKSVLVATGVRESTRTARKLFGHRPMDAFINTGQLQQINSRKVNNLRGRKAIIIGTELVSYSALLSARKAGISVVAMVEKEAQAQSLFLLKPAVEIALRTPIHTSTTFKSVKGNSKAINAVELKQGTETLNVDCDLIIMTGDWQADSYMAEYSGIETETITRAINTDQYLRTNIPGVFASGNVTHPVATSGFCANDGRKAGDIIHQFLSKQQLWQHSDVSLTAQGDHLQITPQKLDSKNLPKSIEIRATKPYKSARITFSQHGEVIYEKSLTKVNAFTGKKIPLDQFRKNLNLPTGNILVSLS